MEQMYTVNEVAKLLGVTRQAIYKWMAEGLLPYVVIGHRRRVKESALQAFVRPADVTE
jgi:excisionase family DNA binding protein